MIKLFCSKKARVLCVIIALAALPLASAGDWVISPDWDFDPYPEPTVLASGYSTSLAGASCVFSCQWQAGNASYPNIGLNSYIFSYDFGTGWTNDTATSAEGGTGKASYTFIYNPTYNDSINSDWMWQYLNNYDVVGFVIAAWTVDLGESFYVIISMILTLALYIRLKNLPVMIAMWFILGTLWVGLIPMASPIILLLYVFGFVSLAFYLYGVSKY